MVAAELRQITIHDLRHGYASLLLEDGAELLYVSEQLGHHKPSFTLEKYGQLIKGDPKAGCAASPSSTAWTTHHRKCMQARRKCGP